MSVNITFFSDVASCGLVETYRRFRKPGLLQLHVKVPTKFCPKMVSDGSSEMSVHFYECTMRDVLEDREDVIVAIVRKEGRT